MRTPTLSAAEFIASPHADRVAYFQSGMAVRIEPGADMAALDAAMDAALREVVRAKPPTVTREAFCAMSPAGRFAHASAGGSISVETRADAVALDAALREIAKPAPMDPANLPESLEQALAKAFNSPGFIGSHAAIDDVRAVVAERWDVDAKGVPVAYAVPHDPTGGICRDKAGILPMPFAEWWDEQRRTRAHWFVPKPKPLTAKQLAALSPRRNHTPPPEVNSDPPLKRRFRPSPELTAVPPPAAVHPAAQPAVQDERPAPAPGPPVAPASPPPKRRTRWKSEEAFGYADSRDEALRVAGVKVEP